MRGRIGIATGGLVAMTLAVCRVFHGGSAEHHMEASSPTVDSSRSIFSTPCNSRVAARRPTPASTDVRGVRHRCLPFDRVLDEPVPDERVLVALRLGLDHHAGRGGLGEGVTATPTGSSACTVPIDTGLVNVNVSCGTASASEDGSGNPTASGTGSLANVSIA